MKKMLSLALVLVLMMSLAAPGRRCRDHGRRS